MRFSIHDSSSQAHSLPLVTVIFAVASYFFMHDVSPSHSINTNSYSNSVMRSKYPETAKFLTPSERHLVVSILKEDRAGQATHFDKKFVWQAMSDYKTYVQVFMYMG